MPKGRYELFWTPSPFPTEQISKVEVIVTVEGEANTQVVAPGASSVEAVVEANKNVSFAVKTYNMQGQSSTSLSFSFTVPPLVAPPPATDLGATLLETIPDEAPSAPVMGSKGRPR